MNGDTNQELLKTRTALRDAEAALIQLRDQLADRDDLQDRADYLHKENAELTAQQATLKENERVMQQAVSQLEQTATAHSQMEKDLNNRDALIAELKLQIEQLDTQLQEKISELVETQASVELAETRIVEQQKLENRQYLVDMEFQRVNTQLEFVKDILLREDTL